MVSDNNDLNDDVSPQQEPAVTPLISSASFPLDRHRIEYIDPQRRSGIQLNASKIADTWAGSGKSHEKGKLGEYAVFRYLGIEDQLNTRVIADGGDGGIDGVYHGAKLQVKTVGRRHTDNPELWVNTYTPLRADYYILAGRVGPTDIRLIGYAPRQYVANAPTRKHDGSTYHIVDRNYLFPFPDTQPIY